MLFVALTSLPAQLSEQTLQHFPYGNLRHAEPTSNGYLLAFNPNPNGGSVVIQKIDRSGQEVWSHEQIAHFPWAPYYVHDLVVMDNDECLVSIRLLDWDVIFGTFNLHFSSDGELLASNIQFPVNGLVSGIVQTLSDQEIYPFLVYSLEDPWFAGGSAIFRIDSANMNNNAVYFPYTVSSTANFFHRDKRNRLFVPIHHGVGHFDPWDGIVKDTLYVDTSHVQTLIDAPDSNLLIVHHESFALISLDGEVLETRQYPGSKLWKAQYVDDNLYLFDHKNTSSELLWILNKETMEVIDVISSFTDGTSFGGVLPGDGEHYVWGNEVHNAFIKPITLSGEYASITTDAALLDFQFEGINVSFVNHQNFLPSTRIYFSDISVFISNTGQDTLNEIIFNLPVDLQTNLWVWFPHEPFPEVMIRMKDIQLLPGQSTWLDAGDLIFIVQEMPSGSLLSIEFCVELSCPNNRIDAIDANDKVCKTFNHLISKNESIETPITISAWPNPFTNQLKLEGLPDGNHLLSLVDVLGRELAFIQLNGSPSATIDVPPGYGGFFTLILKDMAGQVQTTIPLVRSK